MALLSLSTSILTMSIVVFIIFQMIFLLQTTNASPRTDLIPVNHTIHIPNIKDLEFNPVNNNMYISSAGDRRCCIYIIGPTNQIMDNITVPGPHDLEFNPVNNNMYAVTWQGVSVINGTTNEVIDTIRLGDDPRFLTLKFNPANNSMYVSNFDRGSETNIISVLDTTTSRVIENISIGLGGKYLEFNPANNNFYIPNPRSDSVLVIDGSSNRIIDNVTVGDDPFIPMFNPANNNIYVPNSGSNIISVIDISNKVIDNITIPEPVFLEFNPANNNTYVSSITSNVISVINSANKLIQNVTLFGVDPFSNFGIFTTPQLEFNPANTNMYIENPLASCNTVVHSSDSSFGSSFECNSTVAVVDSTNNTVIANVFTGPVANLKFNPANKNVYAVQGTAINDGRDILVIAES